MRLLLDEMLPPRYARDLERGGREASVVTQIGWAGIRNGELLRRARAAGFDVLITSDQNIEHQQNVAQAGIGGVVLIARSNRVEDLRPLVPDLELALASIQPGQVVRVGAENLKDRDDAR